MKTFEYRFNDIVKEKDGFLRGPFGSALKKSIFVPKSNDTYKVYEQGVVLQKNKNIGKYYISNEYFKNSLSRFEVKSGDFLVSCSGVNYGAIYQLKGNIEQGVINQALLRIRLNNNIVDDDFFYYYFQSYIAKVITTGTGDSTIPNFPSMDFIKKIPLKLPSLDDQKKIGKTISILEEKILLNTTINSKLESMAKRLYDYWFVQFDFPGTDGKPYKSSDGKMVWNEELKREIPEGWEVKNLGEIINTPVERIDSNNIEDKLYVPIEVIPRNKMSFSETADLEKAASGLCSFNKEAILLSNRRVYFHKVCISPFDGITRDTVIVIYPRNLENLGYVYQIVNSNHFIDYATVNSYGSEQPVLSTPTVLDYKIPYPKNGLDLAYSKKIESIIAKVLENERETRKLIAMRDKLLPLLMNGQVVVE